MFNKDHQEFLDHHKIPTSQVVDATGISGKRLRELMTKENYVVAVNTNPCSNGNHTMKFKAGHCAQCNSQNLGFKANFYRPGNVYILYSQATQLIKIGSTEASPDTRVKKLNDVRYAEANDWQLISFQNFTEAGKVEFSVHKALRKYRVDGNYNGQSRHGECNELFNCTSQDALAALKTAAVEIAPESSKQSVIFFRAAKAEEQVQRKVVVFRMGDRLKHTKMLDWGIGLVVRDSAGGSVTVRFADGVERIFNETLPLIEKC